MARQPIDTETVHRRSLLAAGLGAVLARIVAVMAGFVVLLALPASVGAVRRLTLALTENRGIAMLAATGYLLLSIGALVLLKVLLPKIFGLLGWMAGRKTVMPGILAMALMLRLLCAGLLHPVPLSDYRTLLDAAFRFSHGDFGYKTLSYFRSWVYQIGTVVYEGVVLLLSNGALWPLYLLNAVWSVATGWLIWRIGNTLAKPDGSGTSLGEPKDTRAALAGMVFFLFSIPSILFSAVLANEHLAMMLFYGAFVILLKKRREHASSFPAELGWDVAAGCLLALGNLIRPLGSFCLLAVAGALILSGLQTRSLRPLVRLCIVVIAYAGVGWTAGFLLMRLGVTDLPLRNLDPLYKIRLGLNQDSNGWFSAEDAHLGTSHALGAERDAWNRGVILQRLSDKGAVLHLFATKFSSFWGDFDGCIIWGVGARGSVALLAVLSALEHLLYPILMLLAAVSILHRIRRNADAGMSLFWLLLVGYALVHLVIEIQTRYRYFVLPALCLMAGEGLVILIDRLPIARRD